MSFSIPWLAERLDQLASDDLLRHRRQTRWLPDGFCDIEGRRLLNFTANDYLNLASDPRVIAAAQAALAGGVGARASALLGGRSEWHVRLEHKLAQFEGQTAAILFPSGMAANIGTIAALVGKEDVIFSDRLNHASLIDGCRLSRANLRIYQHDRLDELDRELRQATDFRRRWIVTDGVFSMDGDLAPLPELCALAERHAAEILVDEAHATGVFGASGRGVAEQFGVEERIAVRVGTLSKAVGCLGGFVAGPQELIDFLWNAARSQVFSTALPPALCAAAEAAIGIIQSEPERRTRLHALANHLRDELRRQGVEVPANSVGPIIPVVIGEAGPTMALAGRLEEQGFLVGAIRPPTVPRGASRLRISLSTAHTEEQLTALAAALHP
jgi:8-amino-7-oxononanoate synthase